MRGQEIIAPSERQRWGAILVALVVAGVVVTRGGTPESTQAEDRQSWYEEIETPDTMGLPWLKSETDEVEDDDATADVRPK